MNNMTLDNRQNYRLMRSKSENVSEISCRVKSLRENEELIIKVQHESSGQWLLDEVCERFGQIQEKDYFGLRYIDKDKQKQWIDLGRSVYRQLKDTHPFIVSFRMKHFPACPLSDLSEETACYFLYLQLRRDLYSGRLLGRSVDLYQLAAYAVQDEKGNHDPETEDLSKLKLLPNLNAKTEPKIIELHRHLEGISQAEARQRFLEKACQLDTYGVEPFYVKDQKGNNLYVGLTHEGISTFQGSRRAHLFAWPDIYRITFKGKMFIIHVYLDEIFNNQPAKKKHILGFKCESSFAAEALWKWANDRLCFFSLNRSSEAKKIKSGGGILKKRRIFKFSGRCQKEIMNISRSMNCLDSTDGISRRNTLVRDQVVTDEEIQNDQRTRFLTMPNRDKGRILGTQDTLDSLFLGGSPPANSMQNGVHSGLSNHGDEVPSIHSSQDEIGAGKTQNEIGIMSQNVGDPLHPANGGVNTNSLSNIVEETVTPVNVEEVNAPLPVKVEQNGVIEESCTVRNRTCSKPSLDDTTEATLNQLNAILTSPNGSGDNNQPIILVNTKSSSFLSTLAYFILIIIIIIFISFLILTLVLLLFAFSHHRNDPTFKIDSQNYIESSYKLAQQLLATSNSFLHHSYDTISKQIQNFKQ